MHAGERFLFVHIWWIAPCDDISERRFEIDYTGAVELLLYTLARQYFTPFPQHLVEGGFRWPGVGPARISSGAYRVRAQSARDLVLERNPFYCQLPTGNIDRVQIHTQLSPRGKRRR